MAIRISTYDDLVDHFSRAFKVCNVRELSETEVEDFLRETLFEVFEAAYDANVRWYERPEKLYIDVLQKMPNTRRAALLLEHWMIVFDAWWHAWDNIPFESWVHFKKEKEKEQEELKDSSPPFDFSLINTEAILRIIKKNEIEAHKERPV